MRVNSALPKWAVGTIIGVAVLVTAACIFAFTYGNIYPNVHVAGIDVGTLSVADAEALLKSGLGDGVSYVDIIWTDSDGAATESRVEFKSGFDAHDAALAAHAVGRDGGGGFFASVFSKKDAEYAPAPDEASFAAAMRGVADTVHISPQPFAADVTDGGVAFSVGTDGRVLDLEAASQRIRDAEVGSVVDLSDLISVEKMELPDVDGMLAAVNKTLKNAEYIYEIDEETGRVTDVSVTDSSPGVSFDAAEAIRLLQLGENFVLPISEVEPELSADELNDALFRDLLASSKTTLNKYNYNRTGNVKLSAEAISGTILRPGDVFSYNDIVGQRTYARGYRDASVYVSSGIEDQLGGGICQTSSTLYMSVLRARLEIVHRANHAYTVVYAPLGEDATVYWGSLDFRFSNNREYPVKIVSWQEDDYIVVEIWGTDVDGYVVETERVIHSSNPYATKQVENPNLEYGKTRQAVEGHSGYVMDTYVIVKDADGNQVDKYKLNSSRYKRLDRVLEIGTKGAPVIAEPPDEPVIAPPPETAAPDVTQPEAPVSTETPPESAPPVEEPIVPAGHE